MNILENNGHDLHKVMVSVNDQIKEAVDSTITFYDLLPNTNYTVKIHYQNKDNEDIQTTLGMNIKTAKRVPVLLGVDFDFSGTRPLLQTVFYDPDQSITRLSVTMSGTTYFVISNQAILTNQEFEELGDVVPYTLLMRYDVGDGSGFREVIFSNPHFYTQMMLSKARRIQTEMIQKILS